MEVSFSRRHHGDLIRWITAFIDVPDDRFDAASRFWGDATGSTLSARRGDRDQFVTLIPERGDAHLRVQRLGDRPRIHLDLHVEQIPEAVDRARDLGARVVAEPGHVILESPGGFTFCIVQYRDEHDRGPRLADPVEHRPDVICIDVPATANEREGRFWAELTDLELATGPEFPEFSGLALRHRGLPWNLLIQRLGDDDRRRVTEAHLDLSAGADFAEVVEHHVALGAEIDQRFDNWTVLRDPAGLIYCITDRNPD